LPVHCVRHQVVGDWEFTIGPAGSKRSSCGHRKPDNPNAQPALSFLTSQGATTTMKLALQEPSAVTTEDGTTGTWTMIYDEAFEVKVNDIIFLAFSDFEFVGEGRTNVSHCDRTQIGWYHDTTRTKWGCYVGRKAGLAVPEDTATAEVADHAAPKAADSTKLALTTGLSEDASADDVATSGEEVSNEASDAVLAPDGATQQTADTSSSAATIEASATADSSADTSGAASSVAEADPTSSSVSQEIADAEKIAPEAEEMTAAAPEPASSSSAGAASELEVSSATSRLDTSAIDAYIAPKNYQPFVPSAGYDSPMNTKWQQSVADALNFLQLGWSAAVYHQHTGKSPRELNRLAGVRHNRPVPAGGFQSSKKKDVQAFNSFLGLKTHHHRTKGHQAFSWKNKEGKDWLEPVVTQGDCGSCYTISTVHMLTARHRIAKGDPAQIPFSVMFPLYCSEYNQGCDGGYGFLQSKWSEDVGLVPESCAKFGESTSCSALTECDMGSTRFRASNHHYVGGYYGASEENLIREELVKNGPSVMSFEPKEDFMYYKGGVYKSGANKIHQEWEQVDHAVLLIGYGEDKHQAYWTLQNSWGTDWGEAGFFRMARGIDESGCESIVVAADVVEEDSNEVLDNFISTLGS